MNSNNSILIKERAYPQEEGGVCKTCGKFIEHDDCDLKCREGCAEYDAAWENTRDTGFWECHYDDDDEEEVDTKRLIHAKWAILYLRLRFK